jgi:hypothetical protein
MQNIHADREMTNHQLQAVLKKPIVAKTFWYSDETASEEIAPKETCTVQN